VSKKGAHPLLGRLLNVVDHRLSFRAEVERLQRQRQWLFDLDHLMELDQQPPPTRQSVSQAVDHYLVNLVEQVAQSGNEEDQKAAAQINHIFRNLWWGLFTCYEVKGLPRTNNDLEQFIRRIKMGHRRISGHKNVQDFILRYGTFAAFIDYAESEEDLFKRMKLVTSKDFLKQYRDLNMIIVKEQKYFRFHSHRQQYLADLEKRWEKAVN
jgi:hypothetical protein